MGILYLCESESARHRLVDRETSLHYQTKLPQLPSGKERGLELGGKMEKNNGGCANKASTVRLTLNMYHSRRIGTADGR
ncbi:hypothetical protein YC2023_103588 [Brassica napus]